MAGPQSRSSFPSVPGEPRVRRLGVGSSGGGDRPLRAQVVVALVCAAMLIAVPLYLMRKPSMRSSAAVPSASAAASVGPRVVPAASTAGAAADPAPPPRLTLGAVQKVRCGGSASSAQNTGTLCDSIAPFEEALKQAVLSREDCAPKAKTQGSINYVLTVDFARKKLHMFPGASGEWRGRQARRAAACVASAIKSVDFNIPHQHRFYSIAVLATYPGPRAPEATPAPSPSSTAPSQPKLPSFE